MHRRTLLRSAAALALSPPGTARARVRPADPGWPSPADWSALADRLTAGLSTPRSPLIACRDDPAACAALIRTLKNPYAIHDDPALTQTCGWVDGWWSAPSAVATEPRSAAEVAQIVAFARDHRLRLVIRGGGHSYFGASAAPDSLLLSTRALDRVTLHDGFVPQGSGAEPVPAVSLGAGTIWRDAYAAVTTAAGRYVQGGGCLTVGTAGLVQGGGFGSYSKAFGTAGQNLLEAEIVTADGRVRVVNTAQDPDLFWALKGGGAGTWGVVTRTTLRTHDLPDTMGAIAFDVAASTDDAWRALVARFVDLTATSLCTPHWGELARLQPGRHLRVGMNVQGLAKNEIEDLWRPFLAWTAGEPGLAATSPLVVTGPARHRWDWDALDRLAPGILQRDDRPGAPAQNVFWTANRAEAGHVIHDFQSLWLPETLLAPDARPALVDALLDASRHWEVEMHFQKGLAGAPAAIRQAARDTPINPAAADAFMLAIVASEGPPAFPGLPGHEPDATKAARDRGRIALAMAALRRVAPAGGAYLVESSFHEPDWQRTAWGANAARLRAIKDRYDPGGLFFVRHGIGSERWSDDGFDPVT